MYWGVAKLVRHKTLDLAYLGSNPSAPVYLEQAKRVERVILNRNLQKWIKLDLGLSIWLNVMTALSTRASLMMLRIDLRNIILVKGGNILPPDDQFILFIMKSIEISFLQEKGKNKLRIGAEPKKRLYLS